MFLTLSVYALSFLSPTPHGLPRSGILCFHSQVRRGWALNLRIFAGYWPFPFSLVSADPAEKTSHAFRMSVFLCNSESNFTKAWKRVELTD